MIMQDINRCIRLLSAKDEVSDFLLSKDLGKYQEWNTTNSLIENEVVDSLNKVIKTYNYNDLTEVVNSLIESYDNTDMYLSKSEVAVRLHCIRPLDLSLFTKLLESLVRIFENGDEEVDHELSLYLICDLLEYLPDEFNDWTLIGRILFLTPSSENDREDFWHHKTLGLGILSEHVCPNVNSILVNILSSDDERLVKDVRYLINKQYS